LTLGPAWRIVQSQIGALRDAGDVLSGSSGKQILIGQRGKQLGMFFKRRLIALKYHLP